MTLAQPLTGSPDAAGSALRGEKLDKSFAGTRVLRDVDITVAPGEIHALLGANGSGKSTLVKCLTGVYQPDGGAIVIGGRRLQQIASPQEADALGIAVVHQEAPLIDSFTVAECIAQFRGYPTSGTRIRWRQLYDEVAAMLARFGLAVDPHTLAGKLSAAERSMVAIVIALERVKSGLKLLVLDEVTASLPRNQAEPYLEQVRAIAASGVGVLMVTHRLAELQGRASAVTLLRDGAVAYRAQAGEIDEQRIVSEMVGSAGGASSSPAAGRLGVLVKLWQAPEAEAPPKPAAGVPALRLDRLTGIRLRGLSLSVAPGEIVGIAGLSEAGVTELPLVLSGAIPARGGTVAVDGRPVRMRGRPRDMIRAGLAVLPADRLHAGGIGPLSVAENALLPDLGRYWHHPERERNVLRKVVADFDIRPPNPMALFGRLSGGNQQKTILAKWLLLRPSVLVLDDPTNGVDPHARRTIFELLRDAAAEGVAVVMFSTEPEQFAAICSRVAILRDGAVAKELTGDELTPQTISKWCYG